MNARCPERDGFGWRPLNSTAWIEILLALCILGAAVELFWGTEIYDWLQGGRISRERASIITSYYQNVEQGLVTKPAESNSLEVYHPDKYSPRIAIRVRTQTGEMRRYDVLRPAGGPTTNWVFR